MPSNIDIYDVMTSYRNGGWHAIEMAISEFEDNDASYSSSEVLRILHHCRQEFLSDFEAKIVEYAKHEIAEIELELEKAT